MREMSTKGYGCGEIVDGSGLSVTGVLRFKKEGCEEDSQGEGSIKGIRGMLLVKGKRFKV